MESQSSWRSGFSMTSPRDGARVAAQMSEDADRSARESSSSSSDRVRVGHDAVCRLITPERAFYRVLDESPVFIIDLRFTGSDDGEDPEDRDAEVVSVHEMMKTTGRTSSRDRTQMHQDRNAYCVKKMPDEIVASSGRLQCRHGPKQLLTTFIRLEHIQNAYMVLAVSDKRREESPLLHKLPSTEDATVEHGRFYFRVLVPVELRRGPDLLAPIISRHLFKNAEEIIECSQTYRCPQSSVMFVKLAYEDGWLFESLNSGIKVLERLATEPVIEYGQFFYIVRIPVGIRVAPNIMAQRSGKGYKLHSIVEGSQRFTPPGSKITYVKVCREKSTRCTCSNSHQSYETMHPSPKAKVRVELDDEEQSLMPRSSSTSSLPTLTEDPEKKNGKFFFRVVAEKKEVLLSPERDGEVIKYLFQNTFFAAEIEYTLPRTQETYVRLAKEKGWLALDSASTPEDSRSLQRIPEELYNLYFMPPSWVWKCTLEEIKHPASALMFTFPWKQIWWIFELESGEKHCVEVQHGLRGGFKAVIFDGQVQHQNRSVSDILWDAGSELVFEWNGHTFKVIIALEGAFFSQYLQFYSYSLLVDEEEILPVEF
ncbi:hypothetical protein P43SY_007742 [Pythium insidiosum]|uniref:Uncharacterized protein n=1 Tax=Pythium insidiosum TaxID=114742 RepID=A0AAD5M078_PYTIN|nr:hypothetical protein P43SY_007742 [Pythium insidiosum]